jgi:hypothetical protein
VLLPYGKENIAHNCLRDETEIENSTGIPGVGTPVQKQKNYYLPK